MAHNLTLYKALDPDFITSIGEAQETTKKKKVEKIVERLKKATNKKVELGENDNK